MEENKITIEIFKEWLSEIIIGNGKSKDLYIKESSRQGNIGPKEYEDRRRFTFYTNNYQYVISVVERSDRYGYLGCTMGCRKARPGEDWIRGNDLPDGILNRKTWDKIKNAIIKNELIKLVPELKRMEDKKEK